MEKRKSIFQAWTPTKWFEGEEAVVKEPDPVPTWNEFTQSTTIHGVKYIFNPAYRSPIRRVFWIFLCIAVMITFVIQLSISIVKYYDYDTTTDVQVIYQESILFPAVTLCNQNNFRTTATADYKLYDYIDDIFSKSADFNPDEHDWQNVSTTAFILETAHQLEDFIDSCTWAGKDCNITVNFQKIVTGIGVCYTFNGGPHPREAQEPGSNTGLSLVLNVEQYEYMRGPNSDAGIKVLLHDPAEEPEMTDQGFVVAPGTHTLVSVLQQQVTSLPPPWGTCNQTADPYHTCMSNCRNMKVASMCKCKDVHMSNLAAGPVKYCNMNDTFLCIRNAVDLISQEKNNCNCSMTCKRTLFEPSLSYATLSEFNIDQVVLTTKAKRAAVKVKFENATEMQQRVVQEIKIADEDAMNHLVATATRMISALNTTYNNCLNTTTLSELYKIPDVLNEELSLPEQDVQYASEHTDELKDMEKSTELKMWHTREQLIDIYDSLFEYYDGESWMIEVLTNCINDGLSGNEKSQNICGPPHPPCDQEKIFLCFIENNPIFLEIWVFGDYTADQTIGTASHDFTNLDEYNAVVNWTFSGETLDAVEYADHYTCQSNLNFYQNTLLPDIIEFLHSIYHLENMTNLNESKELFLSLENMFDTKIGPYLFVEDSDSRWMMPHVEGGHKKQEKWDSERLKCSWYSDIYEEEIDDFEKEIRGIESRIRSEHQKLKNHFESLVEKMLSMMEYYNDGMARCIEAIQEYVEGTITKKTLSEQLTDQDFIRTMTKVNTLNTELLAATRTFEQEYQTFPMHLISFYEKITEKKFPFITDATKANYQFLQQMMTWYNSLGGKELIEQHINEGEELNGKEFPGNTTFTELNIWFAIQNAIEGFEFGDVQQSGLQMLSSSIQFDIVIPMKSLMVQLDAMILQMVEYKENILMNTKFYMKNFLQLDIYYKELSYDQIEQQKAFTFESLLGEVGGFLGLLLGASIVTLCELLDYIVMHCMAACRRRKQTDVTPFSSQAELQQHDELSEKKPIRE